MEAKDKPVKYWDSLQTKESLYEAFDNMDPANRNAIAGNPEATYCYKDEEFKAVGEKLEKQAKILRPVLQDIVNHFCANGEYHKDQASAAMSRILINYPPGIAAVAFIINNALDSDDPESFINRVKTGNGIPEERAARRAYKRYDEFKKKDYARMEAFKKTQEYEIQMAELKLKMRDKIELPEETEE